jgi:hypothetical protein
LPRVSVNGADSAWIIGKPETASFLIGDKSLLRESCTKEPFNTHACLRQLTNTNA